MDKHGQAEPEYGEWYWKSQAPNSRFIAATEDKIKELKDEVDESARNQWKVENTL